jgi:hypothetical protein
MPPGIISPGVMWFPGGIIAPGFMCSSGFIICSPGFISLQQAILSGSMCSCPWPPMLQLRKNPEKKIAATMNKPPATMPTHANAWFRRLGLGREFLGCSVTAESSAGWGTSVVLVIG